MNIIIGNLIHLPFTEFTQGRTFSKFCETIAQVEDIQKNKKSVFYSFYQQKENGYYFTRGLLEDIIILLNINNIEHTITYEYKKLEKFAIENKIEELRVYQKPLEQALKTKDNGFVVVPTGGGKTIVIINEIAQQRENSLILVHTKLLAEQFINRLKQFTDIDEKDIGLYGSGKKEIKKVTIALMQSFGKLKDTEIQEFTSNMGSFFIDEAHHLKAATFLHIAKNVKSKRIYGLTATPDKQDGLARTFLEKILGPLIFVVEESELEKEGVIIKPNLVAVKNEDSYVVDIYKDFYKTNDGSIIKKFYGEQFINSNTDFSHIYVRTDGCTIVEFNSNKELYQLLNTCAESLKNRIKVFSSPIYKTHQNYLFKGQIVFALKGNSKSRQVDMHKVKSDLYERGGRANLVANIILHEFKTNKNKDPYILILSDRTEHLEFMYNLLPEKIKELSVVFNGKLKKKEKEAIDKEIDERKYRVIFSTDKFVGEGWDKSFLDTLVITHALKDHEGLKQLVGRVIRDSPNKKYATVYDIVDVHCGITLGQFKKRYYNYYSKRATVDQQRVRDILNTR